MNERSVLMVEDEMYLAMMLEDILVDAGFHVLRAARLEDALRLAAGEHVDVAILDINLNGEAVYPVAAKLQDQGVPFMFASAYGQPAIPAEYQEHPVLPKPYPVSRIVPALQELLDAHPPSATPH